MDYADERKILERSEGRDLQIRGNSEEFWGEGEFKPNLGVLGDLE